MPQDNIYNARIVSARLSTSNYGLLTGTIEVKYEGFHQGFGGYGLYNPKLLNCDMNKCGTDWIYRVMKVADVQEWDAMAGQPIRVQIKNGLIEAIGHFMDDYWFNPKEVYK